MKVTTDACIFGAVSSVGSHSNIRSILDIGTGTGLLALMKAQQTSTNSPIPFIDAIEINPAAYEAARLNFENSPWAGRLNIYNCSLQQFSPNRQYDLIICNPPFFSNHLTSSNETKNLAIHSQSLMPGELVMALKTLLNPNGGIASILYPDYEMQVFSRLMEESFSVITDLNIYNFAQKPIFRKVREFVFKADCSVTTNKIIIRKDDGTYTDHITSILTPFYLYL